MKKMLILTGMMLAPSFVWSLNENSELWPQIVSETSKRIPFESIQTEFNEGLNSLLKELGETDISKYPSLNDKWKKGQEILKNSKNIISKFTPEAKIEPTGTETVYNQLRDITNNGFYDVSKMLIEMYSLDNLKGLFEHFWQCLWQARDLIEYMKLFSQKSVAELGRSCYDASNLFRRVAKQFTNSEHQEPSLDVSQRLWYLSVYYENENALFEAEDDGDLIRENVEHEIKKGIPQYISGL